VYFGDSGKRVGELAQAVKEGFTVLAVAGSESANDLISKKKGGSAKNAGTAFT
jgi:hypothetical protein